MIGLQVRTWRDYERRYRKYYMPARKRLRHLLDKSDKNTKFLVVSDSDEVWPSLSKIYGKNRILQFPRSTKRLASWTSVDGISEDLIDLLLLAKTQQMFVSYLSTFGEVAWWIGGTKASVSVFWIYPRYQHEGKTSVDFLVLFLSRTWGNDWLYEGLLKRSFR